MIRGTTATHTFTVPFDVSTIDALSVAYSQNGKLKVRKTKDDCVLKNNTISVTLSQHDTLMFTDSQVSIQLKVSRSGVVMASKIVMIPVDRCLDCEVL